MKNKYKMIITAVVIAIFTVITGRIIYVNITYPFAGMHEKSIGEIIEGEEADARINKAELYSKEQWLDYIKDRNIAAEEQNSNYDIHSDYYVLVLDVDLINRAEEERTVNSYSTFNVSKDYVSSAKVMNTYYSGMLADQNSERAYEYTLAANETKSVEYVYVWDERVTSYIIDSLQKGNNQRMKIEVTK